MFGDIVDTSGPAVEGPNVDSCNRLGSKDDVEDAILWGCSERDNLAAERFGDFDSTAQETDVAALLDPAHDVAGRVFEGRDSLDIVARARLIAASRDSEPQRFVRPLRVVDVAPAVESALGSSQIGEGRARQHLCLEAAMEALVLAHGLWMIRSRMADLDAMLDQPDPKRRERTARSIAPRRAIIGNHPLGESIAAEGDDKPLFDRLGLLVAQAASTTEKRE